MDHTRAQMDFQTHLQSTISDTNQTHVNSPLLFSPLRTAHMLSVSCLLQLQRVGCLVPQMRRPDVRVPSDEQVSLAVAHNRRSQRSHQYCSKGTTRAAIHHSGNRRPPGSRLGRARQERDVTWWRVSYFLRSLGIARQRASTQPRCHFGFWIFLLWTCGVGSSLLCI